MLDGASRLSFETGEARAFLWENSGPIIDLNTRIPAGSALKLVYAFSINDADVRRLTFETISKITASLGRLLHPG